ncbi:MAG: hypothetical protein PHI36_09500 [Bacteroidales bacterium]|nr:hypothetical protein [Bacteroidales bacterium]
MSKNILSIIALLFVLVSISHISCKKTSEISLEEKIDSCIRTYLHENLPDYYILDSLAILRIDSISEAEFLLLYRDFLDNTMDVLNEEMNEATKKGDEQTMYDKIDLIRSSSGVYNSVLIRLQKALQKDENSFYMYFVYTKAFFTISNEQKEMQEIGFPIDTSFQVVELSLY